MLTIYFCRHRCNRVFHNEHANIYLEIQYSLDTYAIIHTG